MGLNQSTSQLEHAPLIQTGHAVPTYNLQVTSANRPLSCRLDIETYTGKHKSFLEMITAGSSENELKAISNYLQANPEALEWIFEINGYKYTPLMVVIMTTTRIDSQSINRNFDIPIDEDSSQLILDHLIRHRANVNRSIDTRTGSTTALNLAVGRNDLDLVQILIDGGANINGNYHQGGDFNYTPLMEAISGPNDPRMIAYLLNQGADINIVRNGNRLLNQTVQVSVVN